MFSFEVQWTLDITNPEGTQKKVRYIESSLYRKFSKKSFFNGKNLLYHKCVGDCCNKGRLPDIKKVRSPGNEVDIKGDRIYKDVWWSPVIGEIFQVEMEPDKLVHKYAVCVRKDGKVVGHLKKRLMGRYAKDHLLLPQKRSIFQVHRKICWSTLQSWGRRRSAGTMWTAHRWPEEISGCTERGTVKI